ncbi:tfiih complex helicase [Niveomyces insectorum RCEF 264]|uniref:DNA 3'-5' helicase n=1 Tax=Niveomyces insectorum RCEF 264 TaxID=1081102 RepID=A0A167WXG4_9HYPO|nr:tfiih complex helicase [Niveomyces insectorum RCEF 264]
MPPKRKAPPGSVQAAVMKSGKVSSTSTPGPGTPHSLASSDQYSDDDPLSETEEENIDKAVEKFTLDSHTVGRVPAGHTDAATRFFGRRDFSYLELKPDHQNRPMYIDPERGFIIFESFHPLARPAQDFLITIAEPISRPTFMHEYHLTTHSLYAAVSVGLNPHDIINTLNRFLKTDVPDVIRNFIITTTDSFGKVKLVLKNTKYFLESTDPAILQKLLKDAVIGPLRVHESAGISTTMAPTMHGLVIPGTQNAAGVRQANLRKEGADKGGGAGGGGVPNGAGQGSANGNGNVGGKDGGDGAVDGVDGVVSDEVLATTLNEEEDADDDDKEAVHSFEVSDHGIEVVQKRCLELGYPVLEEYDFRNDEVNANLEIDLRPNAQIRPYQEKSLSKMFGNGRAKSGIIVLPCGAGKTLVGITAACTVKKGVIVLCTSSMSVVQWRQEFLKWSNVNPDDIAVFTSDNKSMFTGNTGIIVTTYSMVTQTRERSHDAKKMMDFLQGREWGLMLLDEVHVVPANIFRKVTSNIKTHSKLGLTATLLREDDKISDLNFLIGPKLYEANWMELSEQGHIARVQCAEVWCPMTTEFFEEYLKSSSRTKQALYVMNPRKFQACQYLINYHESRGDKIIVFSDDVFALTKYATKLGKACIYGATSQSERLRILENFQHNASINTLFLSKIGDTSLDLPEATCLIQISSHYGSRRQEAQRLGRILRAKRRNDEGFNAFFYSLVSKDTQEMFYSSKRQAFLVDQGYAFKVITQLQDLDKTPGLAFATARERRELLQEVLVEREKLLDNGGDRPEDDDDLWEKTQGRSLRRMPKARRTAGTLGELSGGQDMAYIEQNKSVNKMLKKAGGKKGESNAFFKKLQREKERRKQQDVLE